MGPRPIENARKLWHQGCAIMLKNDSLSTTVCSAEPERDQNKLRANYKVNESCMQAPRQARVVAATRGRWRKEEAHVT